MNDENNRVLQKLERPSIFNNPKLLTDEYIPDEFKFREETIDEIEDEIAYQFRDGIGSHLLISGPPGTGKTHSLKFIKDNFNTLLKNNDQFQGKVFYIGLKNKSLYDAFIALNQKISKYPDSGVSFDRARRDLVSKLSGRDGRYVFILDEVDKMKNTKYTVGNVSDLIYSTTRLGESEDEDIELMVILVTNNPSVKDRIESYTRSSFTPEFVKFDSYNAVEVQEILRDRCEVAFNGDVVETGAISWLATQIVRGYGDIRYGLQTLKIAGKQLEKDILDGMDPDRNISEERIEEAFNRVEYNEMKAIIRGLNLVQFLTLAGLVFAPKPKDGVSSEVVQNTYEKISKICGAETRNWVYIRQYILKHLETRGLVTTRTKGRGRGKGQMLIAYPQDPDMYKEVICDVSKEEHNIDFDRVKEGIEKNRGFSYYDK